MVLTAKKTSPNLFQSIYSGDYKCDSNLIFVECLKLNTLVTKVGFLHHS